eukprot:m.17087 g.17087  ORF g.17087 m.17087 type:complete len:599 (+) comp9314_c0_seq1:140-1936(+)
MEAEAGSTTAAAASEGTAKIAPQPSTEGSSGDATAAAATTKSSNSSTLVTDPTAHTTTTTSTTSVCETSPCSNGGSCTESATSTSGFTCACPTNFAGATCTEHYTACEASGLCQLPHGQCVPTTDGGYCVCESGFHGADCQTPDTSNPCIGVLCTLPPAFGLGVCEAYRLNATLPANQHRCVCTAPTACSFLNVDICYQPCNQPGITTCHNGGVCSVNCTLPERFQCACPPGFYGPTCAQTKTMCDGSNGDSCFNNGTCVPNTSGGVCQCLPPSGDVCYTGSLCEFQVSCAALRNTQSSASNSTAALGAGLAVGLVALLALVIVGVYLYHKRNRGGGLTQGKAVARAGEDPRQSMGKSEFTMHNNPLFAGDPLLVASTGAAGAHAGTAQNEMYMQESEPMYELEPMPGAMPATVGGHDNRGYLLMAGAGAGGDEGSIMYEAVDDPMYAHSGSEGPMYEALPDGFVVPLDNQLYFATAASPYATAGGDAGYEPLNARSTRVHHPYDQTGPTPQPHHPYDQAGPQPQQRVAGRLSSAGYNRMPEAPYAQASAGPCYDQAGPAAHDLGEYTDVQAVNDLGLYTDVEPGESPYDQLTKSTIA